MITLAELLRDPVYKKYFCQVPKLPPHITPNQKPWRLMIQKKGETHWRSKRFGTYQEAFRAMKKALPKVKDAAINCPSFDWQPPTKVVKIKGQYITKRRKGKKGHEQVQKTRAKVWMPQLPTDEFEAHHWCPYCRRPTVFRRMAVHHTLTSKRLGGVGVDPTLLRCTICGASENLVNLRHPEAHQKWDAFRAQ